MSTQISNFNFPSFPHTTPRTWFSKFGGWWTSLSCLYILTQISSHFLTLKRIGYHESWLELNLENPYRNLFFLTLEAIEYYVTYFGRVIFSVEGYNNVFFCIHFFLEFNPNNFISESGRPEHQRRLLFNVNINPGPGIRVRRAVVTGLPSGCYLMGSKEGNKTVSRVDVTPNVTGWMTSTKPDSEEYFGITLMCSDEEDRDILLPEDFSFDQTDLSSPRLSLITYQQPSSMDSGRRRRRSLGGTSLRSYESHSSRSRDCDKTRHGKTCCRRSMKISFSELDIKELILEPKEFDAHLCNGRCNARRVPYATTHAMFQHTLHQTKGKKEIPRPCCTPTKLKHLDVLHTVPGTNLLKVTILSNAIVEECSCS